MPRIIFAHKNPRADNPSACHEGLGVTAGNLAETLVENGIQADAVPVVDGYYRRDKLKANTWPGLSHVVMCAPYMDTPFLEGLCRQFPALTFATVYHSNVGFLQADNWAVKVMREQAALEKRIKNYHLAGNSPKFCDSVAGAYGAPCAYLPNLYFLHGPIERRRAPWAGPDLHIGIFGAIRQLKNLMTGVWAAIQIGRELQANTFIHISTGREEGGNNVLKGIHQMIDDTPLAEPLGNVHLVEEPWRPWLDFRRFAVRRMDLLLQPSYTESFNGVTADGIAEGVPSVVSPAIDWVPPNWIANPDKAYEIAKVGERLLACRAKAGTDGYEALRLHNLDGLLQQRACALWCDRPHLPATPKEAGGPHGCGVRSCRRPRRKGPLSSGSLLRSVAPIVSDLFPVLFAFWRFISQADASTCSDVCVVCTFSRDLRLNFISGATAGIWSKVFFFYSSENMQTMQTSW